MKTQQETSIKWNLHNAPTWRKAGNLKTIVFAGLTLAYFLALTVFFSSMHHSNQELADAIVSPNKLELHMPAAMPFKTQSISIKIGK